MSEEKLRKELSKHSLIADISKSRKGYYIVRFKEGVFRIPTAQFVNEIYPDTMEKLKEMLPAYSDYSALRFERLRAIAHSEEVEKSRKEKENRRCKMVFLNDTEKFKLTTKLINDMTFCFGDFSLRPFCKNTIGEIIDKELADLEEWRARSLAKVEAAIAGLNELAYNIKEMDIAEYTSAFTKLKDKYSKYVETGDMPCD